jgi:hypothetical protein
MHTAEADVADQLEVRSGLCIVHSHIEAPCSRCGAMDIHTVIQCSLDTMRIMLGVSEVPPEDGDG